MNWSRVNATLTAVAFAALLYNCRNALAFRANVAAECLWEKAEILRDRRRQAKRRKEAMRAR